ncbi:hypothetical protein ACP4OV_027092 [Aristida adscensionis]
MGAPLGSWPWENLGSYKYLLYGPWIGMAVAWRAWESGSPERWRVHLLLLFGLRAAIYHLWCCFTNMLFLTRRRLILRRGADFHQIDKELNWDNFLILQFWMAAAAFLAFPSLGRLPLWDARGIAVALLLHVAAVEPLFYLLHRRALHGRLFSGQHSLHHSVKVPQPPTAGLATPLEHLAMGGLMALPLAAACATGLGSTWLVFAYPLAFDFLRAMVHCNVEVFPERLFRAVPAARYLITTPTYHTIHHMNKDTNFCLFMPLFDWLGGTLNDKSWEMHKKNSAGPGDGRASDDGSAAGEVEEWFMDCDSSSKGRLPLRRRSQPTTTHALDPPDTRVSPIAQRATDEALARGSDEIPGFVFLVHVVDVMSSMHSQMQSRSYAASPYAASPATAPLWPVAFLAMLALWACSKTFLYSFYRLRGRLLHTWIVPRYGFQYFLPFAKDGINRQIEAAILRADKMGVKVISLAALNKNEALNGGGALFVSRHPGLRVRVVHGNTLTAAVILRQIPAGTAEVFLTGATSKLGRAVALYLCRRRVRVIMLTSSEERFRKVAEEAPAEARGRLVRAAGYESARRCRTWVVGKWLSPREQRWAPPGTHFHQFVVPPILRFRRDCTYGGLAAMRLPDDVQGLGTCEYTLERGVVHACHAGGVVHFLEGYEHHEVGAIDVDRIDTVWEAALRHGLRPA